MSSTKFVRKTAELQILVSPSCCRLKLFLLCLSMALYTVSDIHLRDSVGFPDQHCIISESDVRAS